MKVFIFFWIKALISLVFALLMILLPMTSAAWFGIEVSPDGSMMVQLVGVLLLGIAFVCLYSSRSESALTIRNIMFSLAVTDTVGFLVMLLGQINGLMNGAGIVLVLIWAVLAVGAWIYWVIGGRTV